MHHLCLFSQLLWSLHKADRPGKHAGSVKTLTLRKPNAYDEKEVLKLVHMWWLLRSQLPILNRTNIRFCTDFVNQLAGCTMFSKLDSIRSYHQVPSKEEDIDKTAICTLYGLFEFPRMIFGLMNVTETFQGFIHSVVRDLNFLFPYMYDLLIAS